MSLTARLAALMSISIALCVPGDAQERRETSKLRAHSRRPNKR